MTELILVAHNSAIVDFGNRILNPLNDIRLPLLPMSAFYVIPSSILAGA